MDDKTALALGGMALAKPAVESACRLMEKLFGKPCEAAGEMLTDQLYLWQWRKRISIAEKAAKIMEQKGIAPRVLPTGFLLDFFENAGKIEEATLQELWARLLASAAESDENASPMFVNALRQMSPADALRYKAWVAECMRSREPQDLREEDWRLLHLGILTTVPSPGVVNNFSFATVSWLGWKLAKNVGITDSPSSRV